MATVALEWSDQNLSVTTPDNSKPTDKLTVETSTENQNDCSHEELKTVPLIQEPSSSSDEDLNSSPLCDEPDGRAEDGKVGEDVSSSSEDDRQGRTCLKDADRPSAARLAKRLFYLDGFRKSDVSPHLSKKSVKPRLMNKFVSFTRGCTVFTVQLQQTTVKVYTTIDEACSLSKRVYCKPMGVQKLSTRSSN